MVRSWPIFGLGTMLLLKPGVYGRTDQYPYADIGDRLFRQYLPELIVVLAFTCIPYAGRDGVIVFPEFIAQHMAWLNWWSLFAYVSHWAIYLTIGMPCIGIAIVYGTMPVFFLVFGRKKATTSTNLPSVATESA